MLRSSQFFVAILALLLTTTSPYAQNFVSSNVPTKGYDVTYYNATIWLNRAQNTISGYVAMTATSMGDLPEILQYARFLQIDSVFVDGVRSSTKAVDTSTGAYSVIGFPANYHNGSVFTLATYYHGKGTTEGGSNPWGGVQNMGGMMFTMGVGFTAPYVSCTRHWLPCYDEPDDKADSVTLRFFADTSGIVVSNGLQTAYLLNSDGHTTFCEWTISHPIATYLLTFAFGPFQKLSILNPLRVPFDVYAFAKDTAKVRMLMEKRVVEGLVFFDSLFAPYPFEKVGYVIAPIGSMEHQTMITLVNQVFDTNNTTAVHELSHQWWGDKVTCYDFNDPWLNEGFATFCESLFLERFFGETQYWVRQHSNISGAINTAIPLYGAPSFTKPRNNYPPIIYQKGASVLGMLRYFLGDSVFFNSIRAYGNENAYGTATSASLMDAFEGITHQDLGWFFNKWVYSIGNPIFNVLWSRNANNITIRLEQAQDSVTVGYFRLPLIVEARTYGGKSERHEIQLDSIHVNQVTFTNSFVPDSLILDPDGALIKQIKGTVKLGVIEPPNSTASNNLFALEFNPNPSKGKKITMTVNSVSMKLIGAELMIFDSNGNNVSTIRLSTPQASNSSQSESSSFSLDMKTLPSGTYFATLLLNGTTIGGRGNFTVVK